MSNLAHTRQCTDPQLRQWTGRQGDLMQTCDTCLKVSSVRVRPEDVEPDPEPTDSAPEPPQGRWWLACCRCEGGTWVSSPRPRVPLCQSCKAAA